MLLLGTTMAAAQGALSGMVVTNLAFAVVLGVSLHLLWGMLNLLQLIVHFPMMGLDFPENTNYMFK